MPDPTTAPIGAPAPAPEPQPGLTAAYYDFTPDLLASFPLVELAAAVHAVSDAVLLAWSAEVRASIPAASRLPFDELADNLPRILAALAQALGSADPAVRHGLLERSRPRASPASSSTTTRAT